MSSFIEDTYSLKQILWLSSKLCLMPPLVGTKVIITNSYKYYTNLISLLTILSILYSLSRKFTSLRYKLIDPTYLFLEILQEVMLVSTAFLLMVTRTFLSKEKIQDLLNSLEKIDEYLKPDWKGFKAPLRYVVLQHLFIFFVFSLNITNWISLTGLHEFHYHIFKHFNLYQIAINNVVVYSFSSSLLLRSQGMNINLNSILSDIQNQHIDILDSMQTIKTFIRMYSVLSRSMVSFNSVFGFSVLCTFSCVIVDILMNATVLGHFMINKLEFAETSLMVSSRISWIIFSLSLPTMLAFSCDSATKAAKEVGDICTKYLNLLPPAATDERSKMMKEKLRLLSSMSTSVKPFSAAGFFTINRSMLGLIIASVPPYLIFMLECLQKETMNFYGTLNVTSISV